MSDSFSTEEIVALLRELVAELLEIDISEVAPEADLTDGLCVESLQQLELMARVEQRLNLTLDIEAWLAPSTIADLAQYIAVQQDDDDDD